MKSGAFSKTTNSEHLHAGMRFLLVPKDGGTIRLGEITGLNPERNTVVTTLAGNVYVESLDDFMNTEKHGVSVYVEGL